MVLRKMGRCKEVWISIARLDTRTLPGSAFYSIRKKAAIPTLDARFSPANKPRSAKQQQPIILSDDFRKVMKVGGEQLAEV